MRISAAVSISAVIALICFAGCNRKNPENTTAPAPELLGPVEGEVLANGSSSNAPWSWEFRWSAVSGAEQYHLQVAGLNGKEPWNLDVDSNEPKYSYVHDGQVSFSEDSLKNWSWKVKVRVNGNWSDWSKSRAFSLSKLPWKPSSISQDEFVERAKTEFAVLHLIVKEAHRDKASKTLSGAINFFADARVVSSEKDQWRPEAGNWLQSDHSELWSASRVGLVKDVEVYGLRQTFGRVRAYDPAKRALLIEVGQLPTPREQWQDADELERLVKAYGERKLLPLTLKEMGKDRSLDQMAVVKFRAELSQNLFEGRQDKGPAVRFKAGTKELLLSLLEGPAEQRAVSQAYYQEFNLIPKTDISLVVAPVQDFAAFLRKIDFAEVLFADAETKVVILGPPKIK